MVELSCGNRMKVDLLLFCKWNEICLILKNRRFEESYLEQYLLCKFGYDSMYVMMIM